MTKFQIERVSVSSSGVQGGRGSYYPSISADGRFVTFYSEAGNLVPGDTNWRHDIFVHDRQTGVTERVSVSSSGEQGDWSSFMPSISADGRFVTFWSDATNLVPGDTNWRHDIFVHDRQTGVTERVSVSSSGEQGNRHSYNPSISADGRFVTFRSYATNLVPGDTNERDDVFVHDRQTGVTERVSVSSSGEQGGEWSSTPSISADGRFVTFYSDATNLVPGDTNGRHDIFVHDRQTGVTERVSVSSSGEQGDGYSYYPSISADGRFVAFKSDATNLVPGDTNGRGDIFVHDRQTGQTERVSVSSSGEQGNYESSAPSISADGRFVTFRSSATNLVPGDTNRSGDIFVHDRQTGQTERVSVSSSGEQGGGYYGYPSISADGRFVTFYSSTSNLVPGDTNGAMDIFVATNPLHPDFGLPTARAPWDFSYDRPADMQTFAHLALDAYNGDMFGTDPSTALRPAIGWTPIASTYDGKGGRPVDADGNPVQKLFSTVDDDGLQATAYREDDTGRVVIAYRGTDEFIAYNELFRISVPLGGGLAGADGHAMRHLNGAINFYRYVVKELGVDPSLISFAGHSLGGMLAGFVAALTKSQAMIFASGPHTNMQKDLAPMLSKDIWGKDGIVASPDHLDFSDVTHARIAGEFLGVIVSGVKGGIKVLDVVNNYIVNGPVSAVVVNVVGTVSPVKKFAIDAAKKAFDGAVKILDEKWGDVAVLGTQMANLPGWDNGLLGKVLDVKALHSMFLHNIFLYGDKTLKIDGSYKDRLREALSIEKGGDILRRLGSSILDQGAEHTTDLLNAYTLLGSMKGANYSLKATIKVNTNAYKGYQEALSQILAENAYEAILGNSAPKQSAFDAVRHDGYWWKIDANMKGSEGLKNLADYVESLIPGDDPTLKAVIGGVDRVVIANPNSENKYQTYNSANVNGKSTISELVVSGYKVGNKRDAMLLGGLGDSVLIGGAGNDTLVGGLGKGKSYYLIGGDGNDSLKGNAGNDRLFGGDGHDSLYGGAGNDLLDGGAGDDLIDGGAGNDTVRFTGSKAIKVSLEVTTAQYTGQGKDTIVNIENVETGSGNDTVKGNAGANILRGNGGHDELYGEAGDDRLFGGDGRDSLYGGAGNDRLFGGAGHDRLEGGAGNDSLSGGSGNDSLYGGAGNDTLDGGLGNDLIDGGTGNDTVRFTGAQAITVSLAVTTAQNTGQGKDTIRNINNVQTGSGNDSVTGDAGANILSGNDGHDSLYGGAGNDSLYGGKGNDRLDGGMGND
ncbi:MAG: hypothetical protein Q4G20_12240, partial [Paracoccus sp. (in: a-proteobacteria)]|nr:hypothetical protein [Paracoccus sp. (in: a-proteobacteria)]